MIAIQSIPSTDYGSNCYLLVSGNEAAIVDPSANLTEMLLSLNEANAVLKYIILTHGHFDHMLSLSQLRDRTGAPLCMHRDDTRHLADPTRSLFTMVGHPEMRFDPAEIVLEEGSELPLGEDVIKILHTPGHTPGSMMLLFGDDLVTGDTLFDMSVGRWDFPGGNEDVLYESIFRIYEEYPGSRIYPGHGNYSTVQKQIKYNPFTKRR